VPEVLLSGNHAQIERHRRRESLRLTLLRRPELLESLELSEEDREILRELRDERDSEAH
jgi:tRNA (guanine37-N1)-methyltransferase